LHYVASTSLRSTLPDTFQAASGSRARMSHGFIVLMALKLFGLRKLHDLDDHLAEMATGPRDSIKIE